MGIFRFWQPHSDEYMFMWNSLAAIHTISQLSDEAKAQVHEHYRHIFSSNGLDRFDDVTACLRYDPFWLAVTIADLGIPPLLGTNSAKWFKVSNYRKARNTLFEQNNHDEIAHKVVRDIHSKHGLLLDLNSMNPE